MPAFAIAAAAKVISLGLSFGARKKRKRAARLQQQIQAISSRQRRRAFIRRFREAQAAALVSGVASGAGLESSAVAGTIASQRTQRGVAEGEFIDQSRLSAAAGSSLQRAGNLEFAAGAFDVGASFALNKPNKPEK
jgi:hypothetical protein